MLNELSINVVLYMVVVFLVFAFFLWILMIRPAKKAIDARNAAIKEELDGLDAEKKELEAKIAEAKAKSEELDANKAKILEQTQQEGLKQKSEIIAAGRAEANKMIEEAKARLGSERQKAVIQMKDQIADLATELASKIASKKIDAANEKLLVEQFFSGLK